MAPNKMMGAVDKSSNASLDTADEKPEVTDEAVKQTTPLPVTSDEDVIPDVDNAGNDPEFQSNSTRHLPIDRGWAWVVLGASVFYLALIGGIRKNLGLFFIAFQDRFNSSAALTTSLTMTQNIVTSLGSLFVMTIGMQYINNRISVIIGSCLTTVAYLLSAFATEITLLYLSFGFMEGLGIAMIHAPVTAAIGEYFHKKRGFANGIAYSGASFGGLIFAPVITALFNTYGYTGTMMIVSGMCFNMMLTGLLLRPMSFFDRKTTTLKSTSRCKASEIFESESVDTRHCPSDNDIKNVELRELLPNVNERTDIKPDSGSAIKVEPNCLHSDQSLHIKKIRDRLSPTPAFHRSESHDPNKEISGAGSPLLLRHRAWSVGNRNRTTSETSKHTANPLNQIVESLSRSKVAIYASTDVVYGSAVGIDKDKNNGTPSNIDLSKDPADLDGKTANESLCTKVRKSVVRSFRVLFDKTLLKNPVFQLFLVMAFLVAPSNVFLCICLAPHAKDLGFSSNSIGLLLSVLSGCGTTSRVITAFTADRQFVKLTTLLASVSLFVGLFANCVRLFHSYGSLIAFAAVIGASCEIYQAIYAVILVEYLTLAKLKSCIGFAIFVHGAAFAITFQLVGIMRDATGSYYLPYHVLGTMEIAGAIAAVCLPIVHKRYHAGQKNNEKTLAVV